MGFFHVLLRVMAVSVASFAYECNDLVACWMVAVLFYLFLRGMDVFFWLHYECSARWVDWRSCLCYVLNLMKSVATQSRRGDCSKFQHQASTHSRCLRCLLFVCCLTAGFLGPKYMDVLLAFC